VLDVGEQQTGNAKPQRKSFEPKSDLDEQRKSVSAWGEVTAAVTRPLRQRYWLRCSAFGGESALKFAAQIVAG